MPTREILEPPADFAIDRETLAFIVLKARAFDALVAADDPTDASDSIDDRFVDALEDEADNPAQRELRAAIAGLNSDARAQLVALVWLGRGDYEAADWSEAVDAARSRAETSTARYLMGIPLLAGFIADGADKLGLSLAADEIAGLGDPDLDTRGG
ncbi:MAG: hypothetical protein BroJett013_07930 [Alphaproteobacteria bacterium]|nr:MAG: hypothetical protein BroJett013_07930 [Alphaproteobacteria bacterium]